MLRTFLLFVSSLAVFFFILLIGRPAFAQGTDACAAATGSIELNECAQRQFAQQEKQLNAVYQATLKALDGSAAKPLLVAAQRKWVAFRSADCDARRELFQGGSVAPQVYLDCMSERAKQRAKELDPLHWARD